MVLGGIGGRAIQLESVLTLNVDRFTKGLKSAGSGIDKFSKGLKNHRTEFAAVTAAVTGIGVASVKFASDLTEATNKATVTFGDSASAVSDFAETSANSFGLSKRAANEYAATLGVIIQGSGATQAASAEMSIELVKLAADLASFNNIPIDVALEKIRAGLVGETEPLRTVGVLLSEAAVKTEAYASGIAKYGDELSQQEKVQARYNIILAQTEKQQGDFQRTSEDLANATRRLRANMEDAAASLGEQLIPAATSAVGVFNDLVLAFNDTDQSFKTVILAVGGATGGLAALGLAIPPVVTGVRSLSVAVGFLAANPLVALIAVIGAVAVGGTLLNALRRTQNESKASAEAMDKLSKAMDDAQTAAGAAGRGLSNQQAALEALSTALDDAVSSADVYEAKQHAVALENLQGTSQVVKYKQALQEFEQAQAANISTIDAAIAVVNQYGLTVDEVRAALHTTNLTHQDQLKILKAAQVQTAKAIAQQEDLAGAHRDLTDALEEEQQARRRALIEAAETTEEKLALVDAIAFAEKLARGKENSERILAQRREEAEKERQIAQARADGIFEIEQREAAKSIERTEAYYESLRNQRWANVEDALEATETELAARQALYSFVPSGGYGGGGSYGGGMVNLFPDLTNADLLEAAPQLQFLKDYFETTNPSAIGPPQYQTPGQFVVNIETSDPAPVVSAGYVSGSAAGMIPAAPDTSSREAGF